MPSVAAVQTTTTPAHDVGTLKLRSQAAATPDYVRELEQNGFAVVKNVLTKEQAEAYVSRAFEWLEKFDKGFKRDDKSTWDVTKLPPHHRGGLYNDLGIGHEQLLWDIRAEPALIEVFTKLWGTDELLCSFDGANFSIPLPKEQVQNGGAPWPHVDQSPLRRHKHCIQGIMNLLPNGPTDGGLMVFRGSFPLYKQFFDEHEDDQPEGGWPTADSYHHTPSQLKWFEEKGCEWIHVDAGPGDVILWDSRMIHYGAVPTSESPRIATYVCYKPANLIEPEKLAEKKQAFDEHRNSSHDPCTFRLVPKRYPDVRDGPVAKPVLSERAQQLAGVRAYE